MTNKIDIPKDLNSDAESKYCTCKRTQTKKSICKSFIHNGNVSNFDIRYLKLQEKSMYE